MASNRLYSDPELAQFYDLENGWGEDFDYCSVLANGCRAILDLGCGTGLLAASLARQSERLVVGIDQAAAMLDIARQRPGAERVCWLRDDAGSLRLGCRFDLVLLTGHAFQVFLTHDDQSAVLRTIASHLAPRGRFIFDSRNPVAAAWRKWTPNQSRRSLRHPRLGQVLAWNAVAQDAATGVVTYRSSYETADGRLLSCRSQIAFPSQGELSAMIEDAGLAVEAWLGDWSGAPWEATAPEIIPLGSAK